MGFEPTIFRLEVERVIHCATRVSKYIINELFIFFIFYELIFLILKKIFYVPNVGIEPTATRLKGARSTDWANSAL